MSERFRFRVDSTGETQKEKITKKESEEINRTKREQAEKTLRVAWEAVYKAAATGRYEEALEAMNAWVPAWGDFLDAEGDLKKLYNELASNTVRKVEAIIAEGHLSEEEYKKYQTLRDETNPHTQRSEESA